MQIHPLFSVKKAAEALGVEKQFLRDQLELGMIRGEKRRVGERDKWFIYHGEVRELRDTKRLHEMLEKATRISTDDLGDFFDDDDEQDQPAATGLGAMTAIEQSSAVTDEPNVTVLDDAPVEASGNLHSVTEVLSNETIAMALSEALVSVLSIIETTEKKGTRARKMAARRTDVMRSNRDSVKNPVGDTGVGKAINDVFESLEMQSTLDALIELFENAPIESNEPPSSAESLMESLLLSTQSESSAVASESFDDIQMHGQAHQESVASAIVDETIIDMTVTDDLFVDDLFVEKVELVEPGDLDFVTEGELVNAEDEAISGSTTITIDEILQKLTSEFAFQLAEEKNRVKELEYQLELKNESLRLLPDLQKRLQDEMAVRESHQLEVMQLNEKILLLETSKQAPDRPWWKKLFGA